MSSVEMKFRKLGKWGIKVSLFSLGGWTTFGGSLKDEDLADKIITYAYDQGVNFFDIADIYGRGEAERMMGKVLKKFPRHHLVISSKVFWPMSEDVNDRGLSRKHIMESVEKSLRRIGTDYLDLYFCHRFDPETPLEETLRAMDDLVHQGKILYWGTSEWSGAQIQEVSQLAQNGRFYPPKVEQPQYNLLMRKKFEKEIAPVADSLGMGLVVWSPLASGILTGKYDQGIPEGTRLSRIEWLKKELYREDRILKVREMEGIAKELGCSRAQLALAWTASHSSVSSVITGATSVEQIQENLKALQIEITPPIKERLDQLFPIQED
ncbi:MAG: aldo/keto reductase [Planctomycetota bacterium]|nr:MAG: aldo/keto reductase [Planctomycetota bacterium]